MDFFYQKVKRDFQQKESSDYQFHEVNLFFILPIKVKYLALLDAVYFLFILVTGSWSSRAAIIASLINFLIFFGGDFIKFLKQESSYSKTRRNYRKVMKNR